MSDWEELEPAPKKYLGAVKPPIRFGLYKMRSSRAKGRLLILKDVVAQLGMTTWRVNIRLGKGSRSHQFAVVPHPQGKFELQEMGKSKGGGTFGLNFPVVDTFPDISLPPAERTWRIETEGKQKILVVDMPPVCWNKADRDRIMAKRAAA